MKRALSEVPTYTMPSRTAGVPITHNWHCLGGRERQPYAALYTTLGCPYHCSFCCIQAPFKSGERADVDALLIRRAVFFAPLLNDHFSKPVSVSSA